MSYIILRGCWCNIIVLNVHSACEDKNDNVKDSFSKEVRRVFHQSPRYDMKILLSDVSAKVGREDIFKLTIKNRSSHEISDDSAVRVINFATSKSLPVKTTKFPSSQHS
jgi:hypothetical protein